jgi:predicted protein tyrosine phosphatase
MSILVTPLSFLPELVEGRRPSRVISLLDPDTPFPDLGPSYADRHLCLSFHDAHLPWPGVTPPGSHHVAQLLRFIDAWDGTDPLLVHCFAGIGRSTATAFVTACYRNPKASELAIATTLRRVAPHARPNESLIDLADALLERNGRMSDAIAETGRGLGWLDLPEPKPFELPSRFDAKAVS